MLSSFSIHAWSARTRAAHGARMRQGLRRGAHAAAILLLVCGTGATGLGQSPPIATVALTTGWATFGEVVPQGLAPSGLQIGSLPTQTDVKTRWPDGSIRFAVVTAAISTAGNYAVSAAPASSGSFAPPVPSAAVILTIAGVSYTATLPAAVATDAWLHGPLVREARSVITPVASTGTAHPFLRVNFDTRIYNDGKARVDVSVENLLDKTGATTVTYDATITIGGQAVFVKTGVQHFYLTRWRKVFEAGTTPLARVTPDLGPFNVAKALPPYLSLVSNVVNTPSGSNYDILKPGALLMNMPAHGGRPELAPYPDWTARYLVHRDPVQRSFVLANGDLSGSWPVHVREAETSTSGVGTERMVSLDNRSTIWYDSRAQGSGLDYVKGSPMPIREYGSLTPGPGQSPLIPDTAHQPSIAYVPYLLTGDRYYAEEMAFWANYSMMRTYPQNGVRGSQGILAYNEVRGFGWALRNMVDAAAYYPDASPVRAYLSQKVISNLQWLDTYANAQGASNPFKILWLNKRPEGAQYISMWEQNYLAHAIDRANRQGFPGGTAHRDAIAKFQLTLFTSDPEYPRAQGAPYVVAVGTPSGSSFIYYTSMSQIWNATRGQERPFAGYYGPEARINLMMGVASGWAGAQSAYDYLWPFIGVGSLPDLAQRAGWAVDYYPNSTTPPPPPPPAPAISNVAAGNVTTTSATINWTTNVATNSRVDFGTSSGYGSVATDASMVTSHALALTALAPATTYHYRITSQTSAGDSASTGDLTVTTASTVDTTLPTVTGVTPAAGATGVARTSTVRATFSEAMTAATVTGSTFVLRGPAGVLVAATVAYSATTRTATLTPSQALAASTSYTSAVTGGSGGVKDLAGNALAANYTWSFTTAAVVPTQTPVTIWKPTSAPTTFDTGDRSSVELGLKFRSDVAGKVTGVRFYKGRTTTGTHTATLWRQNGTQLATATFTNETASGWQQVNFATPVAITANTTYVVSYHTNVGNYAYSDGYFATAGVDTPPLHALSNSAGGGNGVYRYGSRAFPSSQYRSTNYWVDVVFVAQ